MTSKIFVRHLSLTYGILGDEFQQAGIPEIVSAFKLHPLPHQLSDNSSDACAAPSTSPASIRLHSAAESVSSIRS